MKNEDRKPIHHSPVFWLGIMLCLAAIGIYVWSGDLSWQPPADKRDPAVIAASKEKTVAAARIMDAQLGKTAYLAGDAFSYGDIPLGIMIYRYVQLIPERPATPNLDRWYAAISARPAFKAQIASVPLT